jgi:anaphase-promoting complex subunit 3
MTSPVSQDGLQIQADEWLRDIVRRCARAYRHLSTYACAEAIREIDTLPVEVQVSPWALEVTARAYYEMANYSVVRFPLITMV